MRSTSTSRRRPREQTTSVRSTVAAVPGATVNGSATISYVDDVVGGLSRLLSDGTRKYVWGLGLAYAVDSQNHLQVYHTDGLGSVRAITDGTGGITTTYQTDAFGNPTATVGRLHPRSHRVLSLLSPVSGEDIQTGCARVSPRPCARCGGDVIERRIDGDRRTSASRIFEEELMTSRVNRAVELLSHDQAIYYVGGHTGHVLTYEQGQQDARTWADYINVGMEHGAFDMTGLAAYMRGLFDGGPTSSGHRTPTVIVEAPVNGTDEANIRFNAWQFRQILGRGVHGILLCQAESPDAVRAFIESCRYPHHQEGVDPALPSPRERMNGTSGTGRHAGDAPVGANGRPLLGIGTRGRGSEPTAAEIWGLSTEEYIERCDPWPLDPRGELLLGVKLESPEGVARCDEILTVLGLGFAEMGPGDLGLSLGYVSVPRGAYPPEMREARNRVFAACRRSGVAFLEGATPETIAAKLDEGVRVISGHREDTAIAGRAYQRRAMPV